MPYRELSHTADWAIHVSAPDLPSLFCEAAQGMYVLMSLELAAEPKTSLALTLTADDAEALLVSFLSELLYLAEQKHLGVARCQVQIHRSDDALQLEAQLETAPIARAQLRIKAVTYHHLAIRATEKGWETVLVFDV